MKTLPITYWFADPLLPKKPAPMPDDGLPEVVTWLPDVIVPAEFTATVAGLPAAKLAAKGLARSEPAVGFASLTALMPLLPDVMVVGAVADELTVMAMLPGPRFT